MRLKLFMLGLFFIFFYSFIFFVTPMAAEDLEVFRQL